MKPSTNDADRELWRAIIGLSRDLTATHGLLLDALAVLRGLGYDIVPRSRDRPEQERPKRHLKLAASNGRAIVEEHNENEERGSDEQQHG
jgi:hypothetical protein